MTCLLILDGENCLKTLLFRISPAVHRLLAGPLDSFEKLEVAMGLLRAAAQTSSVSELVRATGGTRDSIERGVQALRDVKLLDSAGGLLRLTLPAEDAAVYAELAEIYEGDRSVIAQAVSDIAMGKIRGMAARTFGEALASTRKKND